MAPTEITPPSRVELQAERDRLTYEAMADVDAGRVIGQQAVQTWAESLASDTPLPVPHLKWMAPHA